jgi:cell division protein FtsW (lipid II flippase)
VAAWLVDLERSVLPRLSYVPLLAALLLSALLFTLGSGPSGSDARVNLFGVQPVEAIRLLVTLFLAGYFAQRWELLRELTDAALHARSAGWLRVPRRQELIPVLGGVAVVLFAFFLQKDLGPALMVACVFLALYGVARGRWLVAFSGLALLVAGFVAGYFLGVSSTLAARVQIWRSPWDNGARGGDQVAQALWALASGGWTGTGLGRGLPETVPAAHTDLVLAAAGEELGLAGLVAIALLFGVLCARGLRIARRAGAEYSSLLAVGLTVGLMVPVLLIAGGLLGLVPLTGVVTPFLSYGRSALVADFAALGLLLSIADRAAAAGQPSPFAPGARRLGWTVAGLAAGVLLTAARVQTLAADEVMAAGALTRQADGVRRYSYNPRLLAAAIRIVRGTITDRNGLPLATSRPEVIAASAPRLASLGLQVDPQCAVGRRCYPFGGRTFHLVGDADTRVNWAATNTSFAERDRDVRLRGYDDYARVVDVVDPADGSRSRTVRRNLSALLPIWKHRDDPGHPEVKALLERRRDVRLTIDARLQQRVAALLKARVEGARVERGAVVVIDAIDGDLLAAVSYPWPDESGPGMPRAPVPAEAVADRLLDRARYGVYPPGSTFKLVTATAVLRSAAALADEPMICRRLEDGRVGNVVPGWRRPVRDDVADREPHGSVALERGLVRSCNAYFAQLGARLGAAPLRETAALFDIALTRSGAPERLRDTLPFAAYGQGDVLATPYRMARVAAAVAADGVLVPGRWVLDEGEATAGSGSVRVMDAAAARRLARAMREVVTLGTGRGLLAHPEQVAGKTGTAEVEDAPSHSWFVGFAPYGGTGPRRIAFAVIIEHGGYGGRAAAPLAGEIVTAARELGILGPAGAEAEK